MTAAPGVRTRGSLESHRLFGLLFLFSGGGEVGVVLAPWFCSVRTHRNIATLIMHGEKVIDHIVVSLSSPKLGTRHCLVPGFNNCAKRILSRSRATKVPGRRPQNEICFVSVPL